MIFDVWLCAARGEPEATQRSTKPCSVKFPIYVTINRLTMRELSHKLIALDKSLRGVEVLNMRQSDDTKTADMFGGRRPPGRPATGNALTAAQRQAKRRALLKATGKSTLTVVVDVDVLAALEKFGKHKDETQGEIVERILRDRLLRKR